MKTQSPPAIPTKKQPDRPFSQSSADTMMPVLAAICLFFGIPIAIFTNQISGSILIVGGFVILTVYFLAQHLVKGIEKQNALTRQLLRAYGHEPEA